MQKESKIYVAGHRGLVGSALVRQLENQGYRNLVLRTRAELDLLDQAATYAFLRQERPEYVFVAAARVGGIRANMNNLGRFLFENIQIQNNVIEGSRLAHVKKLLFLGSSCIYPKQAENPIREDQILAGPLEPTNEGYAIAKITGVKLCDYYRAQYNCDFISAMPTNTFGPNDNFDLKLGHMLPSLIHKFHLAKTRGEPTVSVWGTGNPRREMIYVDDVAEACLFLMDHYFESGPINIGSGVDFSIREIAEVVKRVVGFQGELVFDTTKPDGVFRKVMDVSRVAKMGWKPQVSLEQGVERAYEWF